MFRLLFSTCMQSAVLPFSSRSLSVIEMIANIGVVRHVAAMRAAIVSILSSPNATISLLMKCIAGLPPDELNTIFFFLMIFSAKIKATIEP